MKKLFFTLMLVCTGILLNAQTATPPAAGDGSSGNPYQIATAANLYWITANNAVVPSPTQQERWVKFYIQTADIDMTGISWTPIGILMDDFKFYGNYNGQGYSISSLNLDYPSDNQIGMFGSCQGATIQNVKLVNPTVRGTNNVGALIGVSEGCLVTNCSVEGGSVLGTGTSIGGLIGNALRTSITLTPTSVSTCSANISVTGGANSSYIGGLIGSSSYTTLQKSFANNIVNTVGAQYVGGLIGYSYNNTISKCYSTGGSTSTVSGNLYIGGLIGQDAGSGITDCYSVANVVGNFDNYAFRGGLIAHTNGTTVTSCYSAGQIPESSNYTGGLIGHNSGTSSTVTNSFWDTSTSLWVSSAGGTGLSTEQMKMLATFTAAGWNALTIWDRDGTTNNGYLHFMIPPTAVAPAAGDGTSGNPYQISNLNELYWISQNSASWNKYFVQTANIDAHQTGALENGWVPIGATSPYFTGKFNGAGYTIDKLYANPISLDYVGLFGVCSGADIKNIGLTNINIAYGGAFTTGALAGSLSTSTRVFSCYSTGTVYSMANSVGGLVGGSNTSKIINSFSKCTVQGNNQVGGLLGWNSTSALLKNSYSTGAVTGSTNYGGLVGANSSTVTNCFWDTESSGNATSVAGTGVTTAQLKSEASLLSWGWNLIVLWDVDAAFNDGYPRLGVAPEVPVASTPANVSGKYQLSSLSHLLWITENSGRWASDYLQTADIDASATAVLNDGDGWLPIGNSSTNFTGSYDGQRYKIEGIYLNRSTNYNGLFGYASGSSKYILGINIENAQIKGNTGTGAILGFSSAKRLTQCSSHGHILGSSYVGGVVGDASGMIMDYCQSSGSVTGSSYIGGLVGNISNSTYVNHSASIASINGTSYVGGIIGMTNYTSCYIYRCYAAGSMNAGYGLIGANYGGTPSVKFSFWDTEATGRSTSQGGGTGATTAQMKTASTYQNVGWNIGHLWEFSENFNGYPALTYLPWITPVAIQPEGDGTLESPYLITSLNELYWIPSGTTAYFRQTANINASETALWNSGAGWSPKATFGGQYDGQNYTIDNLYIYRTSSDYLGLFNTLTYGSVIKNTHLKTVSVAGRNYIGGIAAKSTAGATLTYIDNCSVTGCISAGTTVDGQFIGGFVGQSNSINYTNSYVDLNIYALLYVGGIAGDAYGGNLSRCFAKGYINGQHSLGGLVGRAQSGYNGRGVQLENCYNRASIYGTQIPKGGLVGIMYAYSNLMKITNSYSTGSVNTSGAAIIGDYQLGVTATNTFFDANTAGTSSGYLGTAKTTAQMKTLATYTGWDFVNETANGTNDYWKMDLNNNDGYPWLTWQELPLHWVGGNSASWSDASNWDGSELPVAASNVKILEGDNDPVISSAVEVNDLMITSGQLKVGYNGALTVIGDFTSIDDGLLVESTAAGTGTVITNGAVTGKSIVQQFLQGKQGTSQREWWYIASPVSGALSGVFNPAGGVNKFGSYTESSATYPQISSNDAQLFTGKGYVVKINDIDKVYEFNGTLHSGDFDFAPQRTGTSNAKRGFNLMGNPYPSYLNWDQVIADPATSNMRNALWFRTYNEGTKLMTFHTYADGDGVPLTTSSLIAPMQAFWVKVHADGNHGVLSLKNTYRKHNTEEGAGPLKVRAADNRQRLRLVVSNGDYSDELLIVGKDNSSNELDVFDVEKMSNDNTAIPEIYSLVQQQELVINAMNRLSEGVQIDLGFRPGRSGDFTLKVTQFENIAENVFLRDKLLNLAFELKTGAEYVFASDAIVANQRFSIEFKAPDANTAIDDLTSQLRVYVNANRQLVVRSQLQDVIQVFNLAGQQLMQLEATGSVTVLSQPLSAGVYLVKVAGHLQKVVVN